jgi:cytochrome P450 family 135
MPSNLPPGPRAPGPLNVLRFQRRTTALLESAHERYGDVWSLRLAPGTVFVMVSDPKLIEDLLTTDPEVLYSEAKLAIPLVGEDSLLVSQGDAHTAKRKLMEPLVHGERVKRSSEISAQICERELVGWPLNEPMPLLPRLQAITLKVITNAVFGESEEPRQESIRTAVTPLLEFGTSARRMAGHQLRYMRGWAPSRYFRRLRERVDALIFEEIERGRHDPRLEERDDVFGMLLRAQYEDGSPVTDRDVRDQVVTLLMQGHTSTASGLAWALERVMRHSEVYERLLTEAQTESDDYLGAVIKETLRLRPPNPFVMRIVNKQFQLGEYDLAPGTMIAGNTWMLHRRADVYPEPDRFDPERFVKEAPGKYTWIPFGGGTVRGCIGASFALSEMKVVLRTLFRQTRLEPADQGDEEIRRQGIGFAPSRGARAVLLERVPAAGVASVS